MNTRNPLAGGLLEVASILVGVTGRRKIVQQAAFRRAISSAYYALFHTVCHVVSDGLGLWASGDEDGVVYRSLTHARVKDILASARARELHPDLDKVGALLVDLRTLREDADYSGPGSLGTQRKLLTRREAEALVAAAADAVARLDKLPAGTRKKLALLLTFGLGRGQKDRR